MGLLGLLCRRPAVAESGGSSCEGAGVLSLLWLGAGSCCLRGLVLLSPLSSGCSSVCTPPGSAGQPSSLGSRGLLSEVRAPALLPLQHDTEEQSRHELPAAPREVGS